MTTRSGLTLSAAGLAALASPAAAQDFYVGAGLSSSTLDALPSASFDDEARIASTVIMAGARFSLGSNLFVGGEVQASRGTVSDSGHLGDWSMGDTVEVNQVELHFGLNQGRTRFFGFVGAGDIRFGDAHASVDAALNNPIYGLGAEFSVTDRAAIRVEAEFSKMSYDDSCGSYEPETNSVAAGVIFSF